MAEQKERAKFHFENDGKVLKMPKVIAKNYSFHKDIGICIFCNTGEEEGEHCGRLLKDKDDTLSVHNYCLLFASGLSQNGKDHEGIDGFLLPDILEEYKRGRRLKCYYCAQKTATIGCSGTMCKRGFHFNCGFKEEAMFLFFGTFLAYCKDHRPQQNVTIKASDPATVPCAICMEDVEAKVSNQTLKTPCCNNTWFHRACVQFQALSAGYFFRCAICNNQDQFQEEMKNFGIYIPEHDASWEQEENAFQDLYWRHDTCDIEPCKCPDGKNFNKASSKWELVLCDICGSSGCHLACGGLQSPNQDWACAMCSVMLSNATEVNCTSAGSPKKSPAEPKESPKTAGQTTRTSMKLMGKHPRTPLSSHSCRKKVTATSPQTSPKLSNSPLGFCCSMQDPFPCRVGNNTLEPPNLSETLDCCRPSTSGHGKRDHSKHKKSKKRKLSFNSKENYASISPNMSEARPFKKHCTWKRKKADLQDDKKSTSKGLKYGPRTTLRMSMRPRNITQKCSSPGKLPVELDVKQSTFSSPKDTVKETCQTETEVPSVSTNLIDSTIPTASVKEEPRSLDFEVLRPVSKATTSTSQNESQLPIPNSKSKPVKKSPTSLLKRPHVDAQINSSRDSSCGHPSDNHPDCQEATDTFCTDSDSSSCAWGGYEDYNSEYITLSDSEISVDLLDEYPISSECLDGLGRPRKNVETCPTAKERESAFLQLPGSDFIKNQSPRSCTKGLNKDAKDETLASSTNVSDQLQVHAENASAGMQKDSSFCGRAAQPEDHSLDKITRGKPEENNSHLAEMSESPDKQGKCKKPLGFHPNKKKKYLQKAGSPVKSEFSGSSQETNHCCSSLKKVIDIPAFETSQLISSSGGRKDGGEIVQQDTVTNLPHQLEVSVQEEEQKASTPEKASSFVVSQECIHVTHLPNESPTGKANDESQSLSVVSGRKCKRKEKSKTNGLKSRPCKTSISLKKQENKSNTVSHVHQMKKDGKSSLFTRRKKTKGNDQKVSGLALPHKPIKGNEDKNWKPMDQVSSAPTILSNLAKNRLDQMSSASAVLTNQEQNRKIENQMLSVPVTPSKPVQVTGPPTTPSNPDWNRSVDHQAYSEPPKRSNRGRSGSSVEHVSSAPATPNNRGKKGRSLDMGKKRSSTHILMKQTHSEKTKEKNHFIKRQTISSDNREGKKKKLSRFFHKKSYGQKETNCNEEPSVQDLPSNKDKLVSPRPKRREIIEKNGHHISKEERSPGLSQETPQKNVETIRWLSGSLLRKSYSKHLAQKESLQEHSNNKVIKSSFRAIQEAVQSSSKKTTFALLDQGDQISFSKDYQHQSEKALDAPSTEGSFETSPNMSFSQTLQNDTKETSHSNTNLKDHCSRVESTSPDLFDSDVDDDVPLKVTQKKNGAEGSSGLTNDACIDPTYPDSLKNGTNPEANMKTDHRKNMQAITKQNRKYDSVDTVDLKLEASGFRYSTRSTRRKANIDVNLQVLLNAPSVNMKHNSRHSPSVLQPMPETPTMKPTPRAASWTFNGRHRNSSQKFNQSSQMPKSCPGKYQSSRCGSSDGEFDKAYLMRTRYTNKLHSRVCANLFRSWEKERRHQKQF